MNEKVLKTLEYDKILAMAASHARADIARDKIRELLPSDDSAYINSLLDETQAAQSIILRQTAYPIKSFSDISFEIMRMKKDAVLGCDELLKVASVLRAAVFAKKNISASELAHLTDKLYDLSDILREIESSILSETEVADDASPELKNIRRNIRKENENIRERLNSYLKNTDTSQFLQENLITQRNGRYVLPVRLEYKSRVPGLVHDQSSSGQTLFIEPVAIVEANNRLKQLNAEEMAEIARILAALSAKLSAYEREVTSSFNAMISLDIVFAKAEFSISAKLTRPIISDEKITHIKNGRHPLIDSHRVVPVTIKVGDGYKGLIITGPNTGGKTVTLKLMGLTSLMAQTGLFIYADENSTVGIYKEIFADIGDEQSIEQSLSTFSSHMKNIIGILKKADEDCLVLLDELGAGTDPQEGAALAAAILERLASYNATILATTHYSEIKALAVSNSYFENAGMEFDLETLSPTYRLFIGMSGKSNAFLISSRLGIDDEIINSAKAHMSADRLKADQLIAEAERTLMAAKKEQEMAREAAELAEKRLNKSAAGAALADEQAQKIMEAARQKAQKMMDDAKLESERIIGELKRSTASFKEITEISQKARSEIKKEAEKYKTPEKKKTHAIIDVSKLKVGDEVIITSINAHATVLDLPDRKGNLNVQAGIMKMNVNVADLTFAPKKNSVLPKSSVSLERRPVALSKDVRGMTVEEALIEVDKYIDEAYLHSLNEVTIIHGKGTGALKAGIQKHLKGNKAVKEMRDGRFGEGEGGVTVVTINK